MTQSKCWRKIGLIAATLNKNQIVAAMFEAIMAVPKVLEASYLLVARNGEPVTEMQQEKVIAVLTRQRNDVRLLFLPE